jgi:ABC-type bacteriocin/lantibiotic exporters, contain an N-terminal double-glycine peptidase domain
MMSNKEAVRRLIALISNYKKTIAVIMICLFFSTGLNLCVPLLSSSIMDDGFIGGNKTLLIQLGLFFFAVYMIYAAINLLKEKMRIDISAKIQYFLSERSFLHLMKMNVSFFSNRNYAEIFDNINVDIGNITSIADESVFFVFTQAFSMTGGIIGLFILDYRMTILVLLFIPIKCIIMRYFAKRRKQLIDKFIHDNQKYAGWFGDTVGGIREVKLFGIFNDKHKEFSDKQMQVINSKKKVHMLGQWNSTIDTILVRVLTTLIYIVGANMVFNMQLSVGNVFAFITYSAYVTGPISAILNIGYLLSGIIPSTKRYYEFMELEEENDNGDAVVLPQYGDVELQNVSFSYDKEKIVLKDISLLIPQGSKIAFIGKNGSGKSTIIDLLLRMYEPTEGKILLSGSNIADMELGKYRNMISVVSQDIYMFNDTIRNNICLYKQVEDNKILEMCEDSGLKDFISEVSLDYQVGQNGTKLSGGQKQKVALARALLYDRPIVIFDEATSSTDEYSEQQINSLLHTKLIDKTVIVVTHRTNILNEMDQIVELDDGRVCEK